MVRKNIKLFKILIKILLKESEIEQPPNLEAVGMSINIFLSLLL